MRELFVEKVIDTTESFLDNNQRIKLKEILTEICIYYRIEKLEQSQKEEMQRNNEDILNRFISSKEIEGCSTRTLNYYRDNIRRTLSSFFAWLENEDYIEKSPVRRIYKVKATKKVKETFTDENLEKLRDTCSNVRDLAILELLISTGMRVGELTKLNISDMNFQERSCIVLGKGNSEREVYFSAKSKMYIKRFKITDFFMEDAMHPPNFVKNYINCLYTEYTCEKNFYIRK